MRAAETPLETQLRLAEQLVRQAALRAAELPLQTQIRLEEQAERQAAFRVAETPLQTQICLKEQAEGQTALRAIETPLQTRIRLEEQNQQQAVIRARDTSVQLQARRIVNAEMQTEHQRNCMHNSWSVFNDSGLQYDPSTDYHNHPLIVIGSMSKKCQFRDALKSKDETAGMCYSNVWDESTMSHKKAMEALIRTLQDLRDSTDIMGGMVVLLAGDFRQTLPVIQRGTSTDEIKACLKSSSLWAKVENFSLKTNMRVHLHNDVDSGNYVETLLRIGDGCFETDAEGCILLSEEFCNLDVELIAKVYSEL
ncbi:hypothetical protein X975_07584, partial [Stegodyphus mimosarum]